MSGMFAALADLIFIFISGTVDLHLTVKLPACVLVFTCAENIRFFEAGLSGHVLYQEVRRQVEQFFRPFL